MTQELRERVARAIHNVWREQNSRGDDLANYVTWDEIEAWERTQILYEADAAIAIIRAEALEEAARVADRDAESCATNVWVFSPPMAGANTEARLLHEGGQQIAESIAAAIRALKETK